MIRFEWPVGVAIGCWPPIGQDNRIKNYVAIIFLITVGVNFISPFFGQRIFKLIFILYKNVSLTRFHAKLEIKSKISLFNVFCY